MERDALIIRIAKTGERLGISAFFNNAGADIIPYAETDFCEKEVSATCETIDGILSRACQASEPHEENLKHLSDAGRKLFEMLLSQPVKDSIRKARFDHIIFAVEESMAPLPWELLHDGRDFLCLRFALSRRVGAQEPKSAVCEPLKRPLNALVLALPSTYLDVVYNEGIAVINEFYAQREKAKASIQIMDVGLAFLRSDFFKGQDIVHFAGHVDYNPFDSSKSGWSVEDGIFSTNMMLSVGRSGAFPSLVFSDAYQYGKPETWDVRNSFRREVYGPAAACLAAGANHYIWTFWKIPDEARLVIVKEFYNLALAGEPVGEALRLARLKVSDAYGKSSLAWATFFMSGDPLMTVFDRKVAQAAAGTSSYGAGSLTMGDFRKFKVFIITVAVCAAAILADRIYYHMYAASRNKPGLPEMIGSGLKHVFSVHGQEPNPPVSFVMEDDGLDDPAPQSSFWIKEFVLGVGRSVREWWTSRNDRPSNRPVAKPTTKPTDKTGVKTGPGKPYEDIFFTEDAVYLNALSVMSIKASLISVGSAAGKRPAAHSPMLKFFAKAKISLAKGESKKALVYAQAAYAAARKAGDRRLEAASLCLVGTIHAESGQYRRAVFFMMETMRLFEELRDTAETANACFNLGVILNRNAGVAGTRDIGYLEKALGIYRSLNKDDGSARACMWLAYSYAAKRNFNKALSYIDRAEEITARTGDITNSGLLYKAYADVYTGMKEYEKAKGYYRYALAVNRRLVKNENRLAFLDANYRMAFLSLSSRDRDGTAEYRRQIAKGQRAAAESNIADRYKNMLNVLNLLIEYNGDIPARAMRRLYSQMSVILFQSGERGMAGTFVDIALSYPPSPETPTP